MYNTGGTIIKCECGARVELYWRGKIEVPEKSLLTAILYTKNLITNELGLSADSNGDRPTTKRLNHGKTAHTHSHAHTHVYVCVCVCVCVEFGTHRIVDTYGTNGLMYRKIIAAYCEKCREYKNKLCGKTEKSLLLELLVHTAIAVLAG